MRRRKTRERWVPLVDSASAWVPMKTPCVSPEINFDDPEPRVVMLVDLTASDHGEFAIRLTADEAEVLAADLSKQATAIKQQTCTGEKP